MRSILIKTSIALAIGLAIFLAWWLQQPGNSPPWNQTSGSTAEPAKAAAAPRAAPLIEVVRAHVAPYREELQAVGTLVSRQSVSLRPQSSGRVTQIHFRDGQRVRKGQVLLQLDDQLQRAELQQVQAELGLAQANHQRNQELVAKGFISQRGLDESAAALQVAQAKLALARTTVDRLRLLAPFDAVAGIGNTHVGAYLREGDEVVSLHDMDVLYVDFRLPERYLARLQQGQPLLVQVDALPGESFQAVVQAIDPQVDEQGRSIALRARLDNQQHRLRPGMFARASLALEERLSAVWVPEEAILASASGASVIRVIPPEEGKSDAVAALASAQQKPAVQYLTERVDVVLGARQPGLVEIRHGIAANDVVMVAGQHRVNASGQRVQIALWPAVVQAQEEAPAN